MKLRTLMLAGAATAAALATTMSAAEAAEKVYQVTESQLRQMISAEVKRQMQAPATPQGNVAELEQRVQDLEISQGAKINAIQAKQDAVQWSFDNGRPIISTGDGRFTMAFRGRFHFDAGVYSQDPGLDVPVLTSTTGTTTTITENYRDLSAGSYFRRAHFGIEGKVFRDFDYEFRYNFGGSAEEAAGAIHTMRIAYNPTPEFRINVGAMQPTFTLDNSTSSNDIMFLERSAVSNALVEEFGGSDSRKGIELTYLKTGIANGNGDFMINAAYTTSRIGVRNAVADDRDHLLGRVAYHHKGPDWDIHVGGNAATILSMGGTNGFEDPFASLPTRFRDRPESRMTSLRLVDTGNIPSEGGFMWGLELAGRYKGLTVQGEYFGWEIDRDRDCSGCNTVAPDPDFTGYYVQASYILTGENRLYNAQSSGNSRMNFGAPRPASPFSSGGTWGAFELAARYSVIDLNFNEGEAGVAPVSNDGAIRGGEQKAISVSLNWYLNRNIRFMFQYQNVDIDRLLPSTSNWLFPPGGPTEPFPNIGQEFDTFAVRTQFAF